MRGNKEGGSMNISGTVTRENGTVSREKLPQLIGECAGEEYCLRELLLFWRSHPYARFSRLAIVYALNGRRLCVEKALKYLVDKRLVKTCIENNITLYSLAEGETSLHTVLDSNKLNWHGVT